jgi:hypothetical protein
MKGGQSVRREEGHLRGCAFGIVLPRFSHDALLRFVFVSLIACNILVYACLSEN